MYVAMTNWPGCLPDTAEDLPTFETAKDAWFDLADGLMEYDRWTEDGSLTPLAVALEAKGSMVMPDGTPYNFTGTVYGPDGYCYSVEVSEDDDHSLCTACANGIEHTEPVLPFQA